MREIDLDAVTTLMREVAAREILPRFQSLASHEIHAKSLPEDPGDIVTDADEAAERALTTALLAMLPGSAAIGEEATARDSTVRDVLETADRAWLIDPLDGTKNFASGIPAFGTMVALCERGDAVASWIHLPLTGQTYVAELGSGAFLDGTRLVVPAPPPPSRDGDVPLAGTPHTKFMPPDVRHVVESNAALHVRSVPSSMCAAVEYPDLVHGRKDFNCYWRLLPWDHAPGALLLTEAGGAVRHSDGRPYRAADRDPLAIAVRHASMWERARAAMLGRA
jgi:fructose-1,6-bisphosphatase/inositol monophosphatase family enzyme